MNPITADVLLKVCVTPDHKCGHKRVGDKKDGINLHLNWTKRITDDGCKGSDTILKSLQAATSTKRLRYGNHCMNFSWMVSVSDLLIQSLG